jgi:hypothetical protein
MSSTAVITAQGTDSSREGDSPADMSGKENELMAEEILESSQSSPRDVHGLKWVLVGKWIKN